MQTARVTISRVFGGGESYMAISIEDAASALGVVRLRMTLEDFALCVTGRGHIRAVVERWVGDMAPLVGKQREVRAVLLDGHSPFNKKEAKKWVRSHEGLVLTDGWMLSDDGTGSQQNTPGKHHVTLCRYVDAK